VQGSLEALFGEKHEDPLKTINQFVAGERAQWYKSPELSQRQPGTYTVTLGRSYDSLRTGLFIDKMQNVSIAGRGVRIKKRE